MNYTSIPTKWVGPINIKGPVLNEKLSVPMATFEAPMWPSTHRGAKISRLIDGIHVDVQEQGMSRSVVFEADSLAKARHIATDLEQRFDDITQVISQTSRFAQLKSTYIRVIGKLVYLRLCCTTGDASGHNMVTKAAEAVLNWILTTYQHCRYISISANLCTDKKVSSINNILGRGKSVCVEGLISKEICQKYLRTSPEKMAELHLKKNLIGSTLAGSLHSANAHFGNMLLACYLATGQDGVNIIEASQGLTHAEVTDNDLYFSVSIPNMIVGTVGNGKHLAPIQTALEQLGCLEERAAGDNAKRLAASIGATVWCGELSLMAAQTNPGELMKSHIAIERRN